MSNVPRRQAGERLPLLARSGDERSDLVGSRRWSLNGLCPVPGAAVVMSRPSHRLKHLRCRAGFAAALFVLFGGMPAAAEDARIAPDASDATITDEKRTLLDLYLRMEEAAGYIARYPDMVLIDVRPGPLQAMSRAPQNAAGHVPILVEREHSSELPPDPDLPVAGMRINPHFARDVEALLAKRGLQKDATIILYCGIGLFSARAADLLAERGYRNVYSILDGVDSAGGRRGPPKSAN